jgi:predicted lipoprotein with Yx(FWY)xxD motif
LNLIGQRLVDRADTATHQGGTVIKAFPVVSAIAAAASLAIVGCGGGYSSGASSANRSGENAGPGQEASGESGSGRAGSGSGPPTASGSGTAAVSVASVGDVGKVLVDSEGLTLYYFEKDKGGKSMCAGACATVWPPLTTSGMPQAMGGVESSKLGTTQRGDGTTQVTYAGWPLYTYAADSKPREDNGTDVSSFGGLWYPLHPNGRQAGD